MRAGDVLIWALVIGGLGIVNLGGNYLFARWLVGQGALRALLSRLLAFAFFFAIAAGIFVLWFNHQATPAA